MASTCFRCRSRSCCRPRGGTSPAASSCYRTAPAHAVPAEVVPLAQGEGVIFAVRHRPVQGTRGSYRVTLRHGVSRLRSGRRHTLGIIFHDAA